MQASENLKKLALNLAVLGLGAAAFYILWQVLNLPSGPDRRLWGDIPKAQNWRLFFSIWLPLSLILLQGAGAAARAVFGRAFKSPSLKSNLIPVAAWLIALCLARLLPDWFLCLSILFVLQAAFFSGLAFRILWQGRDHQKKPKPFKAAAFIALTVFLCLAPLAGWFDSAISTTGDEHVYLMSSQSILADADVNLANQAEQKSYRDYYWGGWHKSFAWQKIWRFPLLLSPAFLLGGRLGVLLFLSALGSLAAGLVFLGAQNLTGDRRAALAGMGVCWLSLPFLLSCLQVYPEVLAGCLLMVCVYALLNKEIKPLHLILLILGGCAAMLFIKIRYLGLVIALLGLLAWRLRRNRLFLGVLIVSAVSGLIGLLLFHQQLSGIIGNTSPGPGSILFSLKAIIGILIDQEAGLFFYAPVLAFSISGYVVLARKDAWQALVCLLPPFFYLAETMVMAPHYWDAGFTYPCRFISSQIPLLALAITPIFARGMARPFTAVFMAALGLSALISLVVITAPELMHTRLEGENTMLLRLGNLMGSDLARFFPSLAGTNPQSGLARHFNAPSLIWLGLTLAVALGAALAPPRPMGKTAIIWAMAGLLILGGGFAAAGRMLPTWEVFGSRMRMHNTTRFRHIKHGDAFSFAALRPGGNVEAFAKLPEGKASLTVHTVLPKAITRGPAKKKSKSYDPKACLSLDGRMIASWRLLDDPELGVRPWYRSQAHVVEWDSPGGTHLLHFSYCEGGAWRGHFMGLDRIRISRR